MRCAALMVFAALMSWKQFLHPLPIGQGIWEQKFLVPQIIGPTATQCEDNITPKSTGVET
jgi:hypothetical protein